MREKQTLTAETRYDAVIVNTSPLLYLRQIHHLELLRELYATVLVPTAVVHELRVCEKVWMSLSRQAFHG